MERWRKGDFNAAAFGAFIREDIRAGRDVGLDADKTHPPATLAAGMQIGRARLVNHHLHARTVRAFSRKNNLLFLPSTRSTAIEL